MIIILIDLILSFITFLDALAYLCLFLGDPTLDFILSISCEVSRFPVGSTGIFEASQTQ